MPTPRTRASRKYNDKTYDRIEFTLQKGGRAELASVAADAGMSVNAYIKEAIKEKRDRDATKK